MAEALSKGPGLIRRVSRGAQGIPNKFRRNGSNAQRDSSCGPVIMRRRSDSRGVADTDMNISDFELDMHCEQAVEDHGDSPQDPTNALGVTACRSSVCAGPEAGVIAPIRSSMLQEGNILTKVTKKKRKNIKFRLDFESAKVCWDPTRLSKQFYIDDVREIRVGAEARMYREEFGVSEAYEPLWFTIIYSDPNRSKGRPFKTMHLIAPDEFTFNLWTRTLESVSRSRIDMMAGLVGSGEKSAKLFWRRAMDRKFDGIEHSEEEETMDLQGVIRLCRSLHINCTENSLRAHFEKASAGSKVLTQSQFLYFVRRLKERHDIKQIHKSIKASGGSELDKTLFFSFLESTQGVDVQADSEYWTNIFEKYARASKSKATSPQDGSESSPLTMSFPAFQLFLSSAANSVFAPARSEPNFDRPLNEYFISSSHNTYLLGRQVAGESSTEAYISALQKGCRCIEIDCWDGGDGRPIVMHGRTLTKSILFVDAIKVIAKYAFVSSPYPLIISLEVHCNPEQQAAMADIMKREFGDQLLLEPLNGESTLLPSPEELKCKILVKVKAAAAEDTDEKSTVTEVTNYRRQRSFSSPFSRPRQLDDSYVPTLSLVSSPPSMSPPDRATTFWVSPRTSTTSTAATSATAPSPSSCTEDSDRAEDKKKKKKTSNIVKVLGDLGVYTRGIKFSDFQNQDAHTYNHIFSFAERTFDRLCKAENGGKEQLEEHNMRCLMRVYPSGHRITSSNFDPIKFWRRGVQMAALNWQTYDLGQQMNEAMFAAGNDRMGYVLKPEELRHDHPFSLPGHKKKSKKLVQFSVDIISAQQLPRPKGLSLEANINPYVEFEMYSAEDKGRGFASGEGGQDASARNGISGIGQPLRKRTRIIEGNGYDPEFKETISMTLETRYPSLVFVRWTVWNSIDGRSVNNVPLATFTAKLSSLQQGYRHLPLYDVNGEQYLFSSLFCRIKKEDYVQVDESQSAIDRASNPKGFVEPTTPLNDASDAAPKSGKAEFFKRVFSRTPSERKKQKKEAKDTESTTDMPFFSRSSTLER